jgi:hypothetical protein
MITKNGYVEQDGCHNCISCNQCYVDGRWSLFCEADEKKPDLDSGVSHEEHQKQWDKREKWFSENRVVAEGKCDKYEME